ncbi:MAG: AraC family transcriptional regulator [Sarcina sp.]
MGNTKYNIFKNTKVEDSNYGLLYISKSKFENDWHSTAHFHPFTEIFYITSGSGTFLLDDKIVKVSVGDLILINPNCLHTEKSACDGLPLEYIVLGIDAPVNFFKNRSSICLDNSCFQLFSIVKLGQKTHILNYLNLLLEEAEIKDEHFDTACQNILSLIILLVVRNSDVNINTKGTINNKLNLECMKIKNYIDSHYADNITLDYLANLAHINKYHLVHSFSKQLGVSPINYLISKRIEESKSLLKTTNYSVRDIASIVGFSNSSYFSQIFKKTTGYSPLKYRGIK